MKKKLHDSDLAECKAKVNDLLKEYNCKILFDEELDEVIIVDNDTNKFEYLEATIYVTQG